MKTKPIAVVGVGAVLPDAPDAKLFWENIKSSRYSIKEVPANRWSEELFYDSDPQQIDKTYSKIGSWVEGFVFEPYKWGVLIPPAVLAHMDEGQMWAIAASREALADYGYPDRELNPERVAVILGNAMGGEKHYMTDLRINTPLFTSALSRIPGFQDLSPQVQQALLDGLTDEIRRMTPEINEDTMPGELSNIIAGRVANAFNFSGPNFVADAACASSFAALQAAIDGLNNDQFDAVLTGGVDRNNGASSFVKFSKIGALSPDGSRPYAEGANGFVMGEGAAIFLLKRLEDAERDQDRIYAVIRGVGSSSDGKGKGITAPNPSGQQLAIRRAWENAGVNPASAGLVEGHGTSTKVGDVVEVNSLAAVFGESGLPSGAIGLGSVKSNVGHLKSAAGAAGLLKVVFALNEKVLPPSANFEKPNPAIDFANKPFRVIQETTPWEKPDGEIRRAGVSAFGFGGTNFHVVVEEYVPGLLTSEAASIPVEAVKFTAVVAGNHGQSEIEYHELEKEPAMKTPSLLDGMFFAFGNTQEEIVSKLYEVKESAEQGTLPVSHTPTAEELRSPVRLVINYQENDQLAKKAETALGAFSKGGDIPWAAYAAQGIYYGEGTPGRVAFLFPGQGSQYVNMMRDVSEFAPVVTKTYLEADQYMVPHLGKPLTDYIFIESEEVAAVEKAAEDLKDTTITQPAVLAADIAMLRLLEEFHIKPDMLIGHSLGEYGALVAAGSLSFKEGLETVSARGRAMSSLEVEDNGCMAAVSAPIETVEEILASIDGYVVLANINSPIQSVLGGSTDGIEKAIAVFEEQGIRAVKIPVSHAFHTRIVAPASKVLRKMLETTDLKPPQLPIAANVTGKLYPKSREEMLDLLSDHIASPVHFVQGIRTLYEEGCRIFVEVGPKRVLSSLSIDILKEFEDVTVVATNHPRKGGVASLQAALCQLYAAGLGIPESGYVPANSTVTSDKPVNGQYPPLSGSVVISGAGLGLPGRGQHVFDDHNITNILNGTSLIESLPEESRRAMLDRRVTRLEKSDAGAQMVMIDDMEQTLKLAGQRGSFDLAEEFGLKSDRVEALDITTQLAIAAGIEALRDAGIPLVMHYKKTSTGGHLPNRWMLPKTLADETGVIFGSAFPGLDRFVEETDRFSEHRELEGKLEELKSLGEAAGSDTHSRAMIDARIKALEDELAKLNYKFDRRFIFRILNMGHSQFAEYIGARGPNTAVNAACATTTHAIAIAEDWIRAGRCRRVVIVAGDDVTGGNLVDWIGTGLLATGATTTEGDLRKAALPFDKRRNGMIPGMGAAALVIEAEDAVRERGMQGIAEVLATDIANSAFHGTRLHVGHVSEVMERLVTKAEAQFGLDRNEFAARTMFMSHETYTPARGGSAAAEISALRHTFGDKANQVIITNTKGYTGHTMGVGVEDVVAVKGLEHQMVPPIANIDDSFEPDPDLGDLHLSRGAGKQEVDFALRLGAGFGSQIAMALFRRIPTAGMRVDQGAYQRWLSAVAGYQAAEVEVVQRTLRVKDLGVPELEPAISKWQYGQGPMGWAPSPRIEIKVMTTEQPIAAPENPVKVEEPMAVQANEEEVKSFVLNLVSEKTGYPVEILDLGLDLEADLGIDTVKQAELFAAVRENYGIPRREDLRLVDYNTLHKVIDFVIDAQGSGDDPTSEPAIAVESVAERQPMNIASTSALDSEEIKVFLLDLVSEKTGYPVEILDLGLDLEADLGIDTVKQAELFAAVRENYGIPRREDLRLVDYNTLNKVIDFVIDAQGSGDEPTPEPAVAVKAEVDVQPMAIASTPALDSNEVKVFVLNLVSEKTGYPVEILDLELDLEADLGIDTVKQAELFAAVRENYGIPRREDLRLVDYNTLRKVIDFVIDAQGNSEAPSTEPAVVSQTTIEVLSEIAEIKPAIDPGEVKTFVLNLVSEKTGYPVEILDLGLDLEADLGIDTVKQAELFAAVRENYGIPRQEDLRLVDYNTLSKVIDFVVDARADDSPRKIIDQETKISDPGSEEQVQSPIKRRVPIPMLRPRLDLCVSTGISLDATSRVVLIEDQSGVAKKLAEGLSSLGVQVLSLSGDTEMITGHIADWSDSGLITGVYYLRTLDREKSLESIDVDEWNDLLSDRLETLFHVVKSVPEDSFLVCATRLDGLHGFGGGDLQGTGLGVAGFAKSLALERPDVLIKAVDYGVESEAAVANSLIAETLSDPAVVEVGFHQGQRFGFALVEEGWQEIQQLDLPARTVFLVSGGTGGISLPIVEDLASRTKGHFYLLGRSPLPDPDHPDIGLLQTDRSTLKQNWMKASIEAGEKLTPAQVDAKIEALARGLETIAAIERIKSLGAEAVYLTGDVTDYKAISAAVRQVAQEEGRVDVLLHAAGFERSRKFDRKSLDEFKTTLAVKATGLVNLYKAIQHFGVLPQAIVLFSSIAGRFGNPGQTDYAAANDLLSKLAFSIQSSHKAMRIVSIDWGAWGEVGMASRGILPKLMEQAGIELMHPADAAPLVYREMVHGSNSETVLSGSLGTLESTRFGKQTLNIEAANHALRAGEPVHVMLSSVTGYHPQEGVQLEVTLDPSAEPFLHDHALEGTPLLPGVMGIEGFAVAAQHISSVLGAGDSNRFRVRSLEDIQFINPFKFYRNEPRHIIWKAVPLLRRTGLEVEITLESRSPSKLEMESNILIRHFSGKVHLQPTDQPIQAVATGAPNWNGNYTLQGAEIYKLYFHGPAFQVLEGVQRSGDNMLGKLRKDLPGITARPTRLDTTPLLLELCLQTAGIWEIGLTGSLSLPYSIGKVKLYRREINGEPIFADVRLEEAGNNLIFSSRVVDSKGRVYLEMENYQTTTMPVAVEESLRQPLKKLLENG